MSPESGHNYSEDEAFARAAVRTEAERLAAQLAIVRGCLRRALVAWDDLAANLEDGNGIMLDAGCIECTCGTVPNHLNTGRCWYHEGVHLLREAR